MWLLRLLVFRRFWLRRLGPVGIAFAAWDIWRRIPARQRQRLGPPRRAPRARRSRHGRAQGMRLARRAPPTRARPTSRFRSPRVSRTRAAEAAFAALLLGF